MGWRTPIYRWNRRMLVIEWRQWSYVVALIAFTVAVGVVLVTAGYNMTTSPAEAGNGTHILFGSHESLADAEVQAGLVLESVDTVRLSQARPLGSATPVTIKSLHPDGTNVAPLIDLLNGRYPTADGEIAGTANQMERLDLGLNDSIQLGEESYLVVGIVENPERLAEEFFLVAPGMANFDSFEMYVTGTDREIDAVVDALPAVSWVDSSNESTATAVLLTTLVVGALLEVGLLSAAVLMVLAQRRVRQLGLIAALGAGRRQVRAAVVAGGVAAGALAVAIGVAVGLAASLLVVPRLESLAGRRIRVVEFPWPFIVGIAAVAVAAAALAAWWPARKMAAMTVAGALRSRRPESRVPIKMTIAGLVLIAVGVGALLAVFSMNPIDRPVFVDVAAFLALPFGATLLAPIAVRLWARFAPRRSLVTRVALADMGRYQSRSAATVAALVVILTIPVVAAVGFNTVEQSPSNVASMPENVVMILGELGQVDGLGGFGSSFAEDPDSVDLASYDEAIIELAEEMGARAVQLVRPIETIDGVFREDSDSTTFDMPLVAGIVEADRGPDFMVDTVPTFVASPELLDALGLAAADLEGRDVLTNRQGRFAVIRMQQHEPALDEDIAVGVVDFQRFSQMPGALLSPGYVEVTGLRPQTSGWLLVRPDDFTPGDLSDLRQAVHRMGLGVAVHEPGVEGGGLVNWLIVIAALLATGVAAIVSALHRAETADVDVAYQSIGASGSFRRKVHGVGIATLVAIAAVLAIVAGVVSQTGFAMEQLGGAAMWRMVPALPLIAILVGVPVMAFLVSWVTTGIDRSNGGALRRFG